MKIAVAGYGIEGAASYNYWSEMGHEVTILDERNRADLGINFEAEVIGGPEAFSDLDKYDMVIRTAGLAPRRLSTARKVWSSTNEFFAQCPAPIIGVTGTKGKGTTSSMIASILSAAGKTVHLVGNIGTPSLGVLPSISEDDLVVFELSSFQLWDLERSPHVAVVLMIEPDHLDVHASFEEYVDAKSNICRHQRDTDVVVYNSDNKFSSQIAARSEAKKIAYPFEIDQFISSIQVPGVHNIENASAAIGAVGEYVQNPDVIRHGLESFTGLPHRLKLIRQVNGVDYYDDNYSSAPGSTVAAIKSFQAPEILILGGYDKQVDLSELSQLLSRQPNIKHIVLIGQTGPRIKAHLASLGYSAMTLIEGKPTMNDIVLAAASKAEPGDVVIMSPACASFDMFKNFADRGDQFIGAVEDL